MVVLNDRCSALQVKECMIIWLQITTIIVVMDHLRRCGTRNAYMHILSIYLRYIIYILHSDQTIGADQNIGSTQNIGAHTLRWNQMRWHVLHCCCTMLWLVVCPCLCFVDPCYCRTYGVPVCDWYLLFTAWKVLALVVHVNMAVVIAHFGFHYGATSSFGGTALSAMLCPLQVNKLQFPTSADHVLLSGLPCVCWSVSLPPSLLASSVVSRHSILGGCWALHFSLAAPGGWVLHLETTLPLHPPHGTVLRWLHLEQNVHAP